MILDPFGIFVFDDLEAGDIGKIERTGEIMVPEDVPVVVPVEEPPVPVEEPEREPEKIPARAEDDE